METMSRSFLLSLLAAPLFAAGVAWSAPAIVRGNVILEGISEQSAPTADKVDKLDAYLSAREARTQGFTAKGQVLIATRFGEGDELHLIDQALGARRQMTFIREPVLRGAFSSDPNRNAFFYSADLGVDGTSQLYYQRVGDPTARRLTDGKSIAGGALWSSSGREIAFSTIARDSGSCDIDIIDPDSGALPRLAAGNECAEPLDWSADDRKLLLRRHVSAYEEYLYILDLGTGQKREVEPSAAKGAIANAKFSRDGTGVYFISNRRRRRAIRPLQGWSLSGLRHGRGRCGQTESPRSASPPGSRPAAIAGTGRGGVLELRSRQQASAVQSGGGQPTTRRLRARRRRQPAGALDGERGGPARPDQVRGAAPHAVSHLRPVGR
jgi:hypothetical protein